MNRADLLLRFTRACRTWGTGRSRAASRRYRIVTPHLSGGADVPDAVPISGRTGVGEDYEQAAVERPAISTTAIVRTSFFGQDYRAHTGFTSLSVSF